ncbi:alpha/beta hydrolase [Streptomyces sp. NPDC018031]|uniref:alpha/beta hydrolase n=1 Tax=Streptomyces sp. NPDC018031 TaxID=3365033 RepID=UPI0037A892DC
MALPPADGPPRAAVLLLHGGAEHGLARPRAWNLPDARMRPFEQLISRATRPHGVVTARVRYRHRGWNGGRDDAARDAEQALDELADRAGRIPVILVGHSMGGRAALRAAGHPSVRAVVGLAPWCPPEDPVAQLRDRRLVLLHGDQDRTTDPRATTELARRAREAGAEVCALLLPGGDHAMLRRASAWHSLTRDTVTGLLGLGPLPPRVDRALAGPNRPGAARAGGPGT